MKNHKIIVSVVVLICIMLGLVCYFIFSQRIIGTDSGYSYSIKSALNGSDMWTISTPKITKITLSKSTKSNLSYEFELQQYKQSVDEMIELEKKLKKERCSLSNTEIGKVAKSTSEEAMEILGTRYSYSVYLICKEISRLEDSCEQIMMSLGGSITK